MGQPEAMAAWRLYCCNWLVLGGMALVASTALTGFSIAPANALPPFAYVAYAFYNYRHPHKRDPLVLFILGSTGQILLIPFSTSSTRVTCCSSRPSCRPRAPTTCCITCPIPRSSHPAAIRSNCATCRWCATARSATSSSPASPAS